MITTVNDAWDLYMSTSTAKFVNLRKDEYRFNTHLKEFWKTHKLQDIKPIDLLTYQRELSDKGLSPKSIHNCLSLLRTIMRKAKDLELYDGNIPVFKMPKFDNRRIRFLTESEASKLLTTLHSRHKLWHDITLFALHTGMRANEIFSLKTEHINIQQRQVTVFDTKNTRTRVIPLNNVVQPVVEEYCENKTSYLFSKNKIRDPSTIFRDAVKKVGLNNNVTDRRNKVVFHTLRHTFASWLVQKDVPLIVVSELLGHQDLRMTMRYSHLTSSQGYEAVNTLNNITTFPISQEENYFMLQEKKIA